ncbi:MAG: lipid-A-disaccharide synthase [Granulosicoccus sp.]
MSAENRLNIMVSAGEASGDSHAAHALQALADTGIPITSFGMGAGALQASGTELIVDCRDLAVIGIVDVLLNYHKFLKRLKHLRQHLVKRKPDLLLLVDYPDFNLKLAETAKSLGIPVLFYVSPQVWAWRAGRVPRIGSLVSHMAVLFPFEVDIYQKANIPVTYVGNPVVHDAVSHYTRDEACLHFGLDKQRKVIALLPGSRKSEIQRHLPRMLNTIKLVEDKLPGVQFLLPVAPTLELDDIRQLLGNDVPASLQISEKDSRDAMRAADLAFAASGTATLETALIGTPMIVIYVVNAINYAIMKRLIRIPDISLVNIVARKRIVPEYLQHEAVPSDMAEDLLSLLQDNNRRLEMIANLASVKDKMGDGGASGRVASLILQLTGSESDANA